MEGSAVNIDNAGRTVTVVIAGHGRRELRYDKLILATGSQLGEVPIEGAKSHCYDIDSWDGAMRLERHLVELYSGPPVAGRDCIVLVGGGMSGIEMAAEMREHVSRHADAKVASAVRIVLVERNQFVGMPLGEELRPIIDQALAKHGVEVLTNTDVVAISDTEVVLSDGSRIETATCITTIGLRASPLTELLPARRDQLGRVYVDDWLRVEGVDDVYAAGDTARAHVDELGNVSMMSCQHSRTMGKYAGFNAVRDLLEQEARRYRQPDYVTCLDLGPDEAVLSAGWERKLQYCGQEAKTLKQRINRELIYPPKGSRNEILAAARIDKNGR